MTAPAPVHPIIDSHVHVIPSSELDAIGWCPSTSSLHRQHSLDEFTAATSAAPSLRGFIFIEADRKFDLEQGAKDGSGWEMVLAEVDLARRIALGTPRDGEGHSAEHRQLCLAFIPWAPVPSGVPVLERYVREVQKRAVDHCPRITGVRYLVQDKPRGVMLQERFIDGLKWLGENGFSFDLGIDQHNGGKWQLEEAIEMMELAHRGVRDAHKVNFIINHLCKPDLSIYNQNDPAFVAWRTAMFKMSKISKSYMKLSGCFSEMPDALRAASVEEIFTALQPYLAVILATFGPSRIMFGSNWPVCTFAGAEDRWDKWRLVVQRFCSMADLSQEEQAMIWSTTAMKAYGLTDAIIEQDGENLRSVVG